MDGARAAVRGLVVAAAAWLALASGGGGSWLGDDLSRQLKTIDQAFSRGDAAAGCALLPAATAAFFDVAEHTKGKLAAGMMQAANELGDMQLSCGLTAPMAAPGQAAPAPQVPGRWKAWYADVVENTRHTTSWLTVFSWVSMFMVGIGVYYVLRRLKRG